MSDKLQNKISILVELSNFAGQCAQELDKSGSLQDDEVCLIIDNLLEDYKEFSNMSSEHTIH